MSKEKITARKRITPNSLEIRPFLANAINPQAAAKIVEGNAIVKLKTLSRRWRSLIACGPRDGCKYC